ncbi:MAG: T9SS type A sorting domain-containing protein [Chitinophagaceae bacterium]
MKRKFYLLSVMYITIISLSCFTKAHAQNEVYWREGFTNNPGNINSSSALAPTTPTIDTADNGIWVLFYFYRTTGSACTSYDPGHLRAIKTAAGSGNFPYISTPKVGFGINEIHFASSGNNKSIKIEKTSSPAPDDNAGEIAAATWTLVGTYTRGNCAAGYGDTTITINDPTATRVRFLSQENYQIDLDSIWLTSTDHIVPIKFSGINAVQANGQVKVSWNIATEINSLRYDIERATDGRNFITIGNVAATNAGKYGFIDNATAAGDNYYRIKGVDRDGSLTYSSIVRINSNRKSPELTILPNPVVSGKLNVQLSNFEKGSYTLTLFSNAGQKVFTTSFNNEAGASTQTLQLPSSVQPGVYKLMLTNGSSNVTKSVVVQ